MENAKPPSSSKRRRHGSCQLFHNFITCLWSTDTNDSVLNPSVERPTKLTPEKFSNEAENECRAIIKADKLGEHQTWNNSQNGAR
ncbi:hypothetical protein LIER_15570 [Lithospermum erythrorhizon]|uniref:Uncharacterized protein n=1 Tax=Lithospermum erythrorhizon TaxID=34254 RepID=A0AAV3Q8P9_LITER